LLCFCAIEPVPTHKPPAFPSAHRLLARWTVDVLRPQTRRDLQAAYEARQAAIETKLRPGPCWGADGIPRKPLRGYEGSISWGGGKEREGMPSAQFVHGRPGAGAGFDRSGPWRQETVATYLPLVEDVREYVTVLDVLAAYARHSPSLPSGSWIRPPNSPAAFRFNLRSQGF